MKNFKMIINFEEKERIDKYIFNNSNFSITNIKKFIKNNAIFVDGNSTRKPDFIINKDINHYEDKNIMMISKKNEMVIHPASSHSLGTLVNPLLYKFKNPLDIKGPKYCS